MLALLLLAAAAALLRWGGAARGAMIAAMALAAAAGTTLPDIDQLLPLGGHRSALSHSLAPAIIAVRPRWRASAAGLCFGLALHLAADLFPRAMRGFATVKLFGASLGAEGSWLWLTANMALGFALAVIVTGTFVREARARRALGTVAAGAALLYLSNVDGGWWAIVVLGGAAWLIWRARESAAGR